MAFFSCYVGLAPQDLLFNEQGFHRQSKETAFGNYCKYLSTNHPSDQKLWPFLAVIPVWRDKTSSSTSRDSIGSPRKRASGNYYKYLSVIKQSDQKLWPFSVVILVWFHKTSSSSSRESIGSPRKRATENYCKLFESDPTVGLKVMALLSCYSDLARQHLLINQQGFQRQYKETGLRKLL